MFVGLVFFSWCIAGRRAEVLSTPEQGRINARSIWIMDSKGYTQRRERPPRDHIKKCCNKWKSLREVKRTVEKLRLEKTRTMTSEKRYLKTCCIYLAGWRKGDISGLDECCMGINEGMRENSVLVWLQAVVKVKTWAPECEFIWQQLANAFPRSTGIAYIGHCMAQYPRALKYNSRYLRKFCGTWKIAEQFSEESGGFCCHNGIFVKETLASAILNKTKE